MVQESKSEFKGSYKLLCVALMLVLVSLACGSGASSVADRNNDAPTATVDTSAEIETPEPIATPTETEIVPEPTATPEPTTIPEPTATPDLPKPIVNAGESDINIRSGPGTDFDVVGTLPAGQSLEIIGRNDDSSWWQVSVPEGIGWIAASVTTASNVSDNIPIVGASIPSDETAPADSGSEKTSVPNDSSPPPLPSEPAVVIVTLDKQAEYVDIQNTSGDAVDLLGWNLVSEKGNQECPLSGVIQPDETLRIWALASDAGQGGYNCRHEGRGIWNNSERDPAVLYDPNGAEVSRVER